MAKYKTYKKERYLFFWLSILAYFVPYVVVTACLLPMMKTATGMKWGIGMGVVFLNALPFVFGIFRKFRNGFPFFSFVPFLYLGLNGFFAMQVFQRYRAIFNWIELAFAVGLLVSCVFWYLHRKYKRKAQTVHDVLKSGLLDSLDLKEKK